MKLFFLIITTLFLSEFCFSQNIMLFGSIAGSQPITKHYRFHIETADSAIEKGKAYNFTLVISNAYKRTIRSTKIEIELPEGVICESNNLQTEFNNITKIEPCKINYKIRIPEFSNSPVIPIKFKIKNNSNRIGYILLGSLIMVGGGATGGVLLSGQATDAGALATNLAGVAAISSGVSLGLTSMIIGFWPRISNKIQFTIPVAKKKLKVPNIPNVNDVLTVDTKTKDKVTTTISKPSSDVDIEIPENKILNDNKYVLIIGNEDYSTNQSSLSTEINVKYAENDARIFKEYCVKTFGIPEKNISLLVNATGSKIMQNIDWLSQLSKASSGNAELIFYYAGHGLPDEQSKEPYLIPVDVSGKDLKYAIKLMDVYQKLTENPAKKVVVYLDACFSGGARNESLLALRGVKIKPKENIIGNNLIVFTSSSGEESSATYNEKQHGIFTYFMLKKIKETKGDFTFQELDEYLKKEISVNSLLINKKSQTPQVLGSPDITDQWKSWKLK